MNSQAKSVRICLEMPYYSIKEAMARGVNPSANRLLVSFGELENPRAKIASYLSAIATPGQSISFSAIAPFVDLKTAPNIPKSITFKSEGDLQFAAVSAAEDVGFIIDSWKAEQLVVVLSDVDPVRLLLENKVDGKKWWKLERSGIEAGILKQLGHLDPVILYSDSRSALEIFGSQSAILHCFEVAKRVAG